MSVRQPLGRTRIPDSALLVTAVDFTELPGDDQTPTVTLPRAFAPATVRRLLARVRRQRSPGSQFNQAVEYSLK
jgi:hypothetical protein